MNTLQLFFWLKDIFSPRVNITFFYWKATDHLQKYCGKEIKIFVERRQWWWFKMRPCLFSVTRTKRKGLWQSTLGCNYFKHSQCNSLLVILGIRNDFKKPRMLMLNSHMPQYEDCILRWQTAMQSLFCVSLKALVPHDIWTLSGGNSPVTEVKGYLAESTILSIILNVKLFTFGWQF